MGIIGLEKGTVTAARSEEKMLYSFQATKDMIPPLNCQAMRFEKQSARGVCQRGGTQSTAFPVTRTSDYDPLSPLPPLAIGSHRNSAECGLLRAKREEDRIRDTGQLLR